ncbi:MAG: hypothetical protein ACYDH6_03655 [Acidimicrobiales bacterium]
MDSRRWLNQTQPQTLVIACFLLYLNAAFGLLAMFSFGGIPTLIFLTLVSGVAGAYGIANERKWGYILALASAFAPLLLPIVFGQNPLRVDPISLIFEIALIVLLLHTQSREYQKIWFK